MQRILYPMLFILLSISAHAQDEDSFYKECVNDILTLKDKWPSSKNYKGETVPTPFFEVGKDVQIKYAEEFAKTTLYKRACQQAELPVGKMHQMDNKIIKSRTISSIVFTAHFHADEYIIKYVKDFSTKKWKLEFSYNQSTYSSPPPVDNIGINIDGNQLLEGSSSQSAFCVIASIANYRYDNHRVGLEVEDSSAKTLCKSNNNEDLGKLSPWE